MRDGGEHKRRTARRSASASLFPGEWNNCVLYPFELYVIDSDSPTFNSVRLAVEASEIFLLQPTRRGSTLPAAFSDVMAPLP